MYYNCAWCSCMLNVQMEAFCVRMTVASHLMVTTDALVCKGIMCTEHCNIVIMIDNDECNTAW